MRFIIVHKTNDHWEAGAVPTPELIAAVGSLIGEMVAANVLRGAEGLRASSQGARIQRSNGKTVVTRGPFKVGREPAAGFSIIRTGSLDEAIEWASKAAEALGEAEIDVRPLTEPWDIGMMPKPADVTTRRYMALRKGNDTDGFRKLTRETALESVTLQPGRRGRRYKNTGEGVTWKDGPFSEAKELIGGYVIVSAESIEDAARWVPRYLQVVGAEEVDLLEVEDAT